MFSQVVLQEASLSASSDCFKIGMRRDVVQCFCSWLRRLFTNLRVNLILILWHCPYNSARKDIDKSQTKYVDLYVHWYRNTKFTKNIFKILRPCGIFPIPFLPGRLCLDCSFVRFQPWEKPVVPVRFKTSGGIAGLFVRHPKNGVNVEILQKKQKHDLNTRTKSNHHLKHVNKKSSVRHWNPSSPKYMELPKNQECTSVLNDFHSYGNELPSHPPCLPIDPPETSISPSCKGVQTLSVPFRNELSAAKQFQFHLPSRELTYPTWGKGKSSSKCHFWGIC